MSVFLDRMQFFLGRRDVTSNLVVKIRNQCNGVLKYHLCAEANPFRNGEYLLLRSLKDHVGSFADVGANLGEYSNYLLEAFNIQRAYIFEPSQKCYNELKSRFSEKDFIEIHNSALSDAAGTAQFYFDTEIGETSSLVSEGKNSYSVSIDTVDNALGDVSLDLLKIDTEGYDFHVLKGAKNSLANGNIRFIQFEYGPYWKYAGSTLYVAIKYLNELGYIIFRIDADGLYEHEYEKFGEYFTYSNFFACKKLDMHLIESIVKRKR